MQSYLPLVLTGVSLVVLFIALPRYLRYRAQSRLPPVSLPEAEAFAQRLWDARLPAAWISLSQPAALRATASRVGGSPYVENARQAWPARTADQAPMIFLAQINFADVPSLCGFPDKGLLQIFVEADPKGQISTDEATGHLLRWFDDPQGNLTQPPPDSLSRFPDEATLSPMVTRQGLQMDFVAGEEQASCYNWPYEDDWFKLSERPAENAEVTRLLKQIEDDGPPQTEGRVGWIGGHPRFSQRDVREDSSLRKLDRVLLHLSADDTNIRLGDSGVLNLMISAKALEALNFDAAYCTWDCA